MARERVCATANIRRTRDGRNGRVEGKIPAAVRDHLGANAGDVLVFEEGSTFVAERAAARGPYFVVTLRRAAPADVEPEPADQTPTPTPPAFNESLEETIRRLRNERR